MKYAYRVYEALVALAFILQFGIAGYASAQSLEFWNSNCRKLLHQYEGKPRHKAFAVSNTAHDGSSQACGYSWSERSKKAAEASAIATCRKTANGSCGIMKSE
jgi:hypothetical protein